MGNEIIKLPKKRYQFHIMREKSEIESLRHDLPGREIRKYISVGGFSAIGFIKVVADQAKIYRMMVSTLRVGKKHLMVLNELHRQGKLENATFIVGSVMKNDSEIGKSYGYYTDLQTACERNGWRIAVLNNHSKVILLDTSKGKFVIETSSNLNENPSIEQFSFEKSEPLYNFYMGAFKEITGGEIT